MAEVLLDGISRRYGETAALQPLTLQVRDGEFLTLLGPSGCGKTTLLRVIAGFVQASTGRIVVDGRDITDLPPQKRDIGMVFQDYALFPHLTVAQNVGFGLRERGVAKARIRERVEELLAAVRLEALGDRLPIELSGGQQQRVALARAIAHPPAILLMDEPFAALDSKLREAMQVELRRLHESLKLTTVFVTHDQAEAMVLSDSIAVMSDGRVVQRDAPEALYRRPASRFVADFLGRMNLMPARLGGEAGGWSLFDAGGARLRAAAPDAAGPDVSLGVRPEHVVVLGEGHDPEAYNRLEAQVTGSLFQGNVRRIFVKPDGADEWTIEAPAQAPIAGTGERIAIGWRPADTVVLAP